MSYRGHICAASRSADGARALIIILIYRRDEGAWFARQQQKCDYFAVLIDGKIDRTPIDAEISLKIFDTLPAAKGFIFRSARSFPRLHKSAGREYSSLMSKYRTCA